MSTSVQLPDRVVQVHPVRPHPFPRRHWRGLAIALALLLALAYVGPSVYVANTLTHPRHLPTTTEPHALGLAVEPVAFPSRIDRLTLRGWLLSAPLARTARPAGLIVFVHGIYGVRDDPTIGLVPIAAELVDAGYDVLLFDLRGHGESDGDRTSLGWYERRDLQGALDWAEARGYGRIGVQGFSMGAATAVLTAAEDPRVAALAIDSGFAELMPVLAVEVPRKSGLPSFYTPGVTLATRLLAGFDAEAIRPAAAMAHLRDRPVLVLHGAGDQRIPASHGQALWTARYGAEGEVQRATFHLTPGADHVQSYHADSGAYLTVVRHFWATALPKS
jgi:pimeloyl-ACP methyl ester carboxylesterase